MFAVWAFYFLRIENKQNLDILSEDLAYNIVCDVVSDSADPSSREGSSVETSNFCLFSRYSNFLTAQLVKISIILKQAKTV